MIFSTFRHYVLNVAPKITYKPESGYANTNSSSYTVVDGMAMTPGSGDYLVIFNGTVSNNTAGASTTVMIYAGGEDNLYSIGRVVHQDTTNHSVTTVAYITLTDEEVVDVRWRVSSGQGTFKNRAMTLLRL